MGRRRHRSCGLENISRDAVLCIPLLPSSSQLIGLGQGYGDGWSRGFGGETVVCSHKAV